MYDSSTPSTVVGGRVTVPSGPMTAQVRNGAATSYRNTIIFGRRIDLGVAGDPGGQSAGEVVAADGVQAPADLVRRGTFGEGEEVAGVADDVDVGHRA